MLLSGFKPTCNTVSFLLNWFNLMFKSLTIKNHYSTPLWKNGYIARIFVDDQFPQIPATNFHRLNNKLATIDGADHFEKHPNDAYKMSLQDKVHNGTPFRQFLKTSSIKVTNSLILKKTKRMQAYPFVHLTKNIIATNGLYHLFSSVRLPMADFLNACWCNTSNNPF